MERKQETEYIPYGPEWEKELMKWTKKALISYIKRLLSNTHGFSVLNHSENVINGNEK